jgi:hypothetical protein
MQTRREESEHTAAIEHFAVTAMATCLAASGRAHRLKDDAGSGVVAQVGRVGIGSHRNLAWRCRPRWLHHRRRGEVLKIEVDAHPALGVDVQRVRTACTAAVGADDGGPSRAQRGLRRLRTACTSCRRSRSCASRSGGWCRSQSAPPSRGRTDRRMSRRTPAAGSCCSMPP